MSQIIDWEPQQEDFLSADVQITALSEDSQPAQAGQAGSAVPSPELTSCGLNLSAVGGAGLGQPPSPSRYLPEAEWF